jgi:HSP20 family protein
MTDQSTLPAKSRSETPAPALPVVFTRLRDEIDRLFDDFNFSRPARSIFAFPTSIDIHPAMELTENKDHYSLSVELPGMDEKDIDIECADGVLTISGEKRQESEEKNEGYLLTERSYGAFKRQQTLPADVDPDAIEAKYAKGVLKLTLKKDQKAQSRVKKIAIG